MGVREKVTKGYGENDNFWNNGGGVTCRGGRRVNLEEEGIVQVGKGLLNWR